MSAETEEETRDKRHETQDRLESRVSLLAASYQLCDLFCSAFDRNLRRLARTAHRELHHAIGEAPRSDHHLPGQADKVHVGELRTRPLVAVVHQGLDATLAWRPGPADLLRLGAAWMWRRDAQTLATPALALRFDGIWQALTRLARTGALVNEAALIAAGLMIVTGCMSWKDAANALSAQVILIVAASLALGVAAVPRR